MFTTDSGSSARRPERWLEPSVQREVLDGLAELIEGHYVFSDVARLCADDLRSSATKESGVAASGFAGQLTTRLRVHDRHFSVTWGEPDGLRVTDREQSEEDAMTFRRRGRGGVLTIRRFDDIEDPAAAGLARRSLMEVGTCEYVLIDVRDNDGGWPSMVEYVLAPFLGGEPAHVVTFKSAGQADHVAMTRPDPTIMSLSGLPVVVLVNGGTGSAAESLAYAFQSLGRATIVGSPTVGAANPIELFAHTTGFHIYISTGAPIDPRTGTNWDQVGVQPSVLVDDEDAMLGVGLDIASRGNELPVRGNPARVTASYRNEEVSFGLDSPVDSKRTSFADLILTFMTMTFPTQPAARPGPRRPLGMPVLALIALAMLGVPRVVLHDLHLIDSAHPLSWILSLGPVAVWVAVALALKVPRPFVTILTIGLIFGVLLILTHQVLWSFLYAENPEFPNDDGAVAAVSRLAVVPGGLFAGAALGAIGGLIAWGLRAVLHRTRNRL